MKGLTKFQKLLLVSISEKFEILSMYLFNTFPSYFDAFISVFITLLYLPLIFIYLPNFYFLIYFSHIFFKTPYL